MQIFYLLVSISKFQPEKLVNIIHDWLSERKAYETVNGGKSKTFNIDFRFNKIYSQINKHIVFFKDQGSAFKDQNMLNFVV